MLSWSTCIQYAVKVLLWIWQKLTVSSVASKILYFTLQYTDSNINMVSMQVLCNDTVKYRKIVYMLLKTSEMGEAGLAAHQASQIEPNDILVHVRG